jgi:hypothetical protein
VDKFIYHFFLYLFKFHVHIPLLPLVTWGQGKTSLGWRRSSQEEKGGGKTASIEEVRLKVRMLQAHRCNLAKLYICGCMYKDTFPEVGLLEENKGGGKEEEE